MVQQGGVRPPAHPPVPISSQFHNWLLTDAALCRRQPHLPPAWVSWLLFYQAPSPLSFGVCFVVANQKKIGWNLKMAWIYIYPIAKDVFVFWKLSIHFIDQFIDWMIYFWYLILQVLYVFLILNSHVVYNLNIFSLILLTYTLLWPLFALQKLNFM